jgi:hypothetical protein
MNHEEYLRWKADADRALSGKYTAEERAIIVGWFDYMKGQDERELVGNEAVEAMLVFVQAGNNFEVYDSLMARLFIYAPLILKQEREDREYRMRRNQQ